MSIEDEALKVLKSVKQMGESVEGFIGKMVNELNKEEENKTLIPVVAIGIGKKFKYKDLIYTKTDNTKDCIINANSIIKGYECKNLSLNEPDIRIFGGNVMVEGIE